MKITVKLFIIICFSTIYCQDIDLTRTTWEGPLYKSLNIDYDIEDCKIV